MREALHPYTVVFYIDADRAVETFAAYVNARDMSDAWDKAIAKASRAGGSSSGHAIPTSAWQNATEIVTYHGHCAPARK